ncbi:hypothetical protein DER46DRAFT_570275 [Fusarium sp. MPI-SDFR-AT-0072]|nr:hypothetical protein DER46DRAFT_570275 [Fusarium sp. MPI-SDFR-AT-0072]
MAAIHENTKKPYPQHYANRVWKLSAVKINGTYLSEGGGVGWFVYLPGNSDVEDNLRSLPRILTEGAEMLYDLLRNIFVYEGRISAEDILGSPGSGWFRGKHNTGRFLLLQAYTYAARIFWLFGQVTCA